jgi:hypothetical protein
MAYIMRQIAPAACLLAAGFYLRGRRLEPQRDRRTLAFPARPRQAGKLLAKSKLRFSLVIAAGLKELLPLLYPVMGLSALSRFRA